MCGDAVLHGDWIWVLSYQSKRCTHVHFLLFRLDSSVLHYIIKKRFVATFVHLFVDTFLDTFGWVLTRVRHCNSLVLEMTQSSARPRNETNTDELTMQERRTYITSFCLFKVLWKDENAQCYLELLPEGLDGTHLERYRLWVKYKGVICHGTLF